MPQEKIHRVVGNDVKPTLNDKEKLPYIEATITEVLRVAPTAPTSLPHWAIVDTEIGGYRIPKETEVQISLQYIVYSVFSNNPANW